VHKFALSKIKKPIERLLSKLKAFAVRHNISPTIFLWLWLPTEAIRYATLSLRGVELFNSNPSVDITLILVNRIASLAVPVYVISRGKNIAWLKIVYVLFFIWGTIEIVGIKLIVDLFS
jgi:hypothetical protein